MKKTKPINKLLQSVFGRHYMNNFRVVRSMSDIPKKTVFNIWGNDFERLFNLYNKSGRFIWIKKDGDEFLVYVGDDGKIMIVDEKDHSIEPSEFENTLGLSYVGLSAENFFRFLLKRDDETKIVKMTESKLLSIIKQILKEQ